MKLVIWQSRYFDLEKVVSTYGRLYANGEVLLSDVDRHHRTVREIAAKDTDLHDDHRAKLRVNEQVLLSRQERG